MLATLCGGATLIAGCGSSDSDPSPTDESSPDTSSDTASRSDTESPTEGPLSESPTDNGGTPVDTNLDLRANWTPSADWDISPYSTQTGAHNFAIYPTLTPFGANAGHPEQDYEPLLIAENELVDNEVWRHSVADGFTWHDGEPVTASDRYAKAKYDNTLKEKLDRDPVFDRVELVDDRTVELALRRKQHPIRFLRQHRPSITHKASLYEPHLEALEDATTGGEAFDVHQNLKAVSIPPEEWVGHGMFQISDVSEDRVILERYEDYPDELGRAQNIERITVPIRKDSSTRSELVANGTTDWFTSIHNLESIPDVYGQIKRRTSRQRGYRLNHTNKHLARRGVRRAIAYRQAWGSLVEGNVSHNPDLIQDGTTPLVGTQWVPDYEDRTAQYIDYGKLPDRNNAAAELEAEGYERNDENMWVGPDGGLLEVTIVEFAGTDWNDKLDSWLSRFGFTTELRTIGGTTDAWASYDGDWDIAYMPHGGGANHPAVSYQNDFRYGVKMTTEEDGERVAVGNRELEYELPTELGATDLSGETETIDVAALQEQISDPAATAEELVEPTRKLSWWWNFYLPDVISYNMTDYYVGDYAEFEWGDWTGDGNGDAFTPYELSYGLHAGHLRSTVT